MARSLPNSGQQSNKCTLFSLWREDPFKALLAIPHTKIRPVISPQPLLAWAGYLIPFSFVPAFTRSPIFTGWPNRLPEACGPPLLMAPIYCTGFRRPVYSACRQGCRCEGAGLRPRVHGRLFGLSPPAGAPRRGGASRERGRPPFSSIGVNIVRSARVRCSQAVITYRIGREVELRELILRPSSSSSCRSQADTGLKL